MRPVPGFVLAALLAVTCSAKVPYARARPPAAVQGGDASNRALSPGETSAASIDITGGARSGKLRNITLGDILSLRELHEPLLSPNGKRIAFVVRQAFRSCNCYRSALYVASTGGGPPRKVAESEAISSLHWMTDSTRIAYLSDRSGRTELLRVSVAGGAEELIIPGMSSSGGSAESSNSSGSSIENYAWSHHGRCIAYSAVETADASDSERGTGPVLYDDRNMRDATQLVQTKASLFLHCEGSARDTKLWESTPTLSASANMLSWSPDDSRIAFLFNERRAGKDLGSGVGVVTIRSQEFLVVSAWHPFGITSSLCWSKDGESLTYLLTPETTRATIIRTVHLNPRTVTDTLTPGIASVADSFLLWREGGASVVALLDGVGGSWGMTGLFSISTLDGAAHRLSDAHQKISECSNVVDELVACVAQSPEMSPRVALVSTRSGSIQWLQNVDVNPQIRSISLGSVEERRWRNALGDETNGYLLLPVNYRKGTRYPLLVIGYGVFGEFITQASDVLTSYPAQAFARDGIAVLLINPPPRRAWLGNDFAQGSRAWGYSPLSSLQVAVEQLAAEGIVDRTRVGFAGHSWAGFWVEFALTKAPQLVRAAEILNGGTLAEPGSYWISGMQTVRAFQEHFMGGPPYPPALRQYESFSPVLNADRVTAPVLIEADQVEAPSELEMYSALRRNGVPVDFYIYPDEGHIFHQPENRFRSMEINLDWFEYWLLGRQDPAPSKREQYVRWHAYTDRRAEILKQRDRARSGHVP